MNTYLECYECLIRQTIEASSTAGATDEQKFAIVRESLQLLANAPAGSKPPELSEKIHRVVREHLHDHDPYLHLKQQNTQQALQLVPQMEILIKSSADPLDTAVRLSVAGNIIDFGPQGKFDLNDILNQVLTRPFAHWDYPSLRAELNHANWLLYLADNTGETVFDRLMIEQLHKPTFYAVKSGAVINDATRADAIAAGIDQVAIIIENGSNAPCTILSKCSSEFIQLYNKAPMIIVKGQGNYEMLSENGPRLFFLLQAKCVMIARDLNAPKGSFIVKQG